MGIRVLLCDDHPVWRAGLRTVLGAEADVTVVADVGDSYAAVRQAAEVRPDVVVVDRDLPGLGAVEVTRLLAGPHVTNPLRVLVVAAKATSDVIESVRAGARGYVLKDLHAPMLIDTVRAIAAGEIVLAPSALWQVFDHFSACPHGPEPDPENLDLLRDLTRRERSVLRLVARGLTNARIATALGLSVTTVKSHVSHILTKLKLQDRAQAVVVAYETGFVLPGGVTLGPIGPDAAERAAVSRASRAGPGFPGDPAAGSGRSPSRDGNGSAALGASWRTPESR
jgi:DNA-binding NarL/FixJ family response regulator